MDTIFINNRSKTDIYNEQFHGIPTVAKEVQARRSTQ